ncbi:MAG: phosphotransferase [Solobacterium sp.]|nr:phosphotransferase [Solobacterium sp.]
MDNKTIVPYVRIAKEIATKIMKGEYKENNKLPLISTLVTNFHSSSKTIHKSLALLEDMKIIEQNKKKEYIVTSSKKAEEYLDTVSLREEQIDLSNELRRLYKEYEEIGKKMINISSLLVETSASPLSTNETLPNYAITVPADSDKVGMTIGELRFWQCTAATIVAIKRGDEMRISPGPYFHLYPGDVIIYVGAPSCKKAVENLLCGTTHKTLYSVQDQITQAIHAGELRVIAEALDTRLGELTDFEPMAKGMTNRSYYFSCKGERYILRIPGEGTAQLINRYHEASVYKAIAEYDICDEIVYLNPKKGLKVSQYLENVRACDAYNKEDIKKAMHLLRSFHNHQIKVKHEFDLEEKIEFYESLRGNTSLHKDYIKMKHDILGLMDYVEKYKEEYSLTHIDAVPDNFLFYTKKDGSTGLKLTDWEYAAMQDPHVDLAMFALYSFYNKKEVDCLIDIYFGGKCKKEIKVKIYCYISICGLMWNNWAEYKISLGVDYEEYANEQYRLAKEFYLLARKEIEGQLI